MIRKYPVFTIMAVLLALIILLALLPFALDGAASFLIEQTKCSMGDPDKTPCLFLGYDVRKFLEDMHFFGWVVYYGFFQFAGIALLIWLALTIALAVIFRLRSKPPTSSGQ